MRGPSCCGSPAGGDRTSAVERTAFAVAVKGVPPPFVPTEGPSRSRPTASRWMLDRGCARPRPRSAPARPGSTPSSGRPSTGQAALLKTETLASAGGTCHPGQETPAARRGLGKERRPGTRFLWVGGVGFLTRVAPRPQFLSVCPATSLALLPPKRRARPRGH